MKTRFYIIISGIVLFSILSVLVLSTQFTYVFDDGILPIAIYSKMDIYKLQNTPDQLKEIFGNCNCQADPERTCEHTFIDWQNSTHYIDNNLCEFITLEEHDG